MFLNMKSSTHEIPTSKSTFLVAKINSRVHVLERAHYPSSPHHFRDLELRMCCGLAVRDTQPKIFTLLEWNVLVAVTQNKPVGSVLRTDHSQRFACMECDRIFNQSEVAC